MTPLRTLTRRSKIILKTRVCSDGTEVRWHRCWGCDVLMVVRSRHDLRAYCSGRCKKRGKGGLGVALRAERVPK